MSPNNSKSYPDGRPGAALRIDARDTGIILRHGGGPGGCDAICAREAVINYDDGLYYLFYDGAAEDGWRVCLAVSSDLTNWEKRGPMLDLGLPGELDHVAAVSPWVIREGDDWHMFYIGSPNGRPVPEFPYVTLKAKSRCLQGPWAKQREVVPFTTKPGTFYSATASAGHVVRRGDEYLMFFSGSVLNVDAAGTPLALRTVGIARTRDLDGEWTIDPEPIAPLEEQIENTSLYFEPANQTWFLFTNHIGLGELGGEEYTDAAWVYWSKYVDRWDTRNKAVVLDGQNCSWSKRCIGMPTVLPVGNRLALFYDAPGGDSISHLNRDIGLAWLDLPLTPPEAGG